MNLGKPIIVKDIRDKIRNNILKSISFHDFMSICLFHEPEGYYVSHVPKIGPDGDFYTSSSVGTLMGEMIAAYLIQIWESEFGRSLPFTVVEWGGGNGRLALHILDEVKKIAPGCYSGLNYVMIEASGYHRDMQAELLQPHLARVSWMSDEDWFERGERWNTVVLANELLDAFPVFRVRRKRGRIEENRVGWDEQEGRFLEEWHPLPADDRLQQYLVEESIDLKEGQIAEINLDSLRWIRRIGEWLRQGHLLVIDYGDAAEELYAEHRMQGTLMCYRKHQASMNPYEHVGEQDMTAHINFTACMRAAKAAGLEEVRLQTQREFLVAQGILGKLQDVLDTDPFAPAAKRNRAIRQLLISDSMSELFKVMTAAKKTKGDSR